jgi:leucyl-tRNA synthetase
VKFRAHGLIIREGAKMSKSKGNVIVPDPIIEEHGADTFRLYLMFLGPFEEGGDYRDEGIQGPWGFLHRLFDTVVSAQPGPVDPAVEGKLHRTIRQVSQQLAELQYNTSIAALMEYLNVLRTGGRRATRGEVEPLVVMIAPFCPHLAEELWEALGHRDSIFDASPWPGWDEAKTVESQVAVAVQVNGKLRATIQVPRGAAREQVEALARSDQNVARHLDGARVNRVVYVPERLVNFVVAAATPIG